MTQERTIKEEIDTSYKDFSLYTLYSRAIPSAIDGFKMVQRKLLYHMLQQPNPYKQKVKNADLGAISKFEYHHGESSAQAAVAGMAQSWANNAPIFVGHGNFGSRKVQEAAAARYIFCTLSPNYDKYFKDHEVCPSNPDPASPEPEFYLPTIPWVLVNGIRGIAVGFATNILPRDPDLLSKLVKKVIKDPECKIGIVPPKFPDFRGTVEHVSDLTWKIKGAVEDVNSTTLRVTEVPYGEDRSGYLTILNDLCDKNIINDYEDKCSGDGFEFIIKCSRAQKEDLIKKDPVKVLKLERQVTENLTMIGHDWRVRCFDDVESVIKYFVSYRLGKVAESIALEISKQKNKISVAEAKAKFIKACISGEIDFMKLKKADLILEIERQITTEEYGRDFVNIPIYNLTKDSVEALENSVEGMRHELEILESTTASQRYLSYL